MSTCHGRLAELIRFLAWLHATGLTSLAELDAADCDAWLAHRRYQRDADDVVVGERSSGTRRLAALIVADLVNYRELFTADRVRANLRPWAGAAPSAIAGDSNRGGSNKTAPAADEVFAPMLAAALHLVQVIGPHTVGLAEQVRAADAARSVGADGLAAPVRFPTEEVARVLAEYERDGQPLPMARPHHIQTRIDSGWAVDDLLTPVALAVILRQAGFRQFHSQRLPELRPLVEATVTAVGVEPPFGRRAEPVRRADVDGTVGWTRPLHREQAATLIGVVCTATILTLASITGMRASELMELQVGCRLPPQESGPGLARYRLAGKLVKGQPLGGVHDEWVVIADAYQAAGLAEQLHPSPADGELLFGRFHFKSRYQWFRAWVNGPDGQRLGLAPIPDRRLTLRMLRRKLAIELAYRPGGLLATKIYLHHVSAATEGYASRPGGAQAELLAEVNKHEADRNLELVLAEFRNYQQGILPSGNGARELIEFFSTVDDKLEPTTATAPRTQRSDRDVLNLLSKRAAVLHLGPANYCWFTDPARALCLKLAGTPAAETPLIGMCDSARCPQATHHAVHRPVWAAQAERTKVFLGQLGPTRTTERARLQTDYDRALRIIDSIDAAAPNPDEDSA